tara:strand:- start:164647 stop:165321 length:675 start_codon:yes stop_codon:yes gene_type:complete
VNITLLFVALAAAIILWFFVIRRLRAKPWTTEGILERNNITSLPAEKVGLWAFLAVVTSLFSLFFIMYAERSGYPDWRPLPDPSILWVNTFFLIMASICYQLSRNLLNSKNYKYMKISLYLGGIFTIFFILGQISAWQMAYSSGFFFATNPANTFFYLITGLHGLHILGGLFVWIKTALKVWNGLEYNNLNQIAGIRLSIQLCSFYWHYLLLLWLVLFYLLSTT